MSTKVSIDEMASVINQKMSEYASLATEDMKEAVQKTATDVKEKIKSTAPRDTGKYAKSWNTKKTTEDSTKMAVTVYSKTRYRLTHLLEKGHALRNGGRTRAIPHIAPAEEEGETELKRLITNALKR